eukprot:361247-Chlamydomonas_euryale.AAC.2
MQPCRGLRLIFMSRSSTCQGERMSMPHRSRLQPWLSLPHRPRLPSAASGPRNAPAPASTREPINVVREPPKRQMTRLSIHAPPNYVRKFFPVVETPAPPVGPPGPPLPALAAPHSWK